jgi:hypothetical protein
MRLTKRQTGRKGLTLSNTSSSVCDTEWERFNRSLSYSYVNESRGQVRGSQIRLTTALLGHSIWMTLMSGFPSTGASLTAVQSE